MSAVPEARAVTCPEALTLATAELLDDHDTFLFEAFEGETVAIKVSLSFSYKESEYLFSDIPLT
jgi:hypothetical protein